MNLDIPGWTKGLNNIQNVLIIAKVMLLGFVGIALMSSFMPTLLFYTLGLLMVVVALAIFWFIVSHWNAGITK